MVGSIAVLQQEVLDGDERQRIECDGGVPDRRLLIPDVKRPWRVGLPTQTFASSPLCAQTFSNAFTY